MEKLFEFLENALKDVDFGDILSGGSDIYSAYKAGDMMDFNKSIMKANNARAQDLFDREKRDEEARRALDF